jgi:hypothetical protein
VKKSLLLLAVLVMAGCRAGLSPEARLAGESVSPAINRTSDAIAGAERDLHALLNDPKNAAVRPFAARAGFDQGFSDARGHLERAREIQKARVAPSLKDNRAESASEILKSAAEVRAQLDEARAAVARISKTRDALLKAASDLPSFSSHVASLADPLKAREAKLLPAIAKAKAKHPPKANDLEGRLAKFRRWAQEVRDHQSTITRERAKKTPDLLSIVQADERATVSAAEADKQAADTEKRMADLDRTVTRRLEDMRLDYQVTFARSSWDEYAEYDDEGVYPFRPVKVSLHLAEKLSKRGGEAVDAGILREAGINPYMNLPAGHSSYEFWIEDVDDQAFHKYLETVDGKSTLTDWIPVDDTLFDRHEKDLGMEIYVKPYGMYADEAITTATPPGMAFVGNSRYGHWNGSTWNWLPAYLFYSRMFDGNHFYQRDQWNRWNQTRLAGQPYYGEGEREEERAYGTNGRLGRVYYGNSNWGRTSGFRTYDLSFRGLGPEYRGGGPGGGGK